MLFRSGKSRHTSSEVSARQFCDTEFQDPKSRGLLRELSVYRIEPQHVVQCHAEHYAGAGLEPRGRPDLDLDGLGGDVETDPRADWPFRMTPKAHCTVRFAADDDVLQMASLLLADLAARTYDVRKEAIQLYVRLAVERQDAEWITFLAQPNTSSKWRACWDNLIALRFPPDSFGTLTRRSQVGDPRRAGGAGIGHIGQHRMASAW